MHPQVAVRGECPLLTLSVGKTRQSDLMTGFQPFREQLPGMAGPRQTYCCSLRGTSGAMLYRSGNSFLNTRSHPFVPRLIPLARDWIQVDRCWLCRIFVILPRRVRKLWPISFSDWSDALGWHVGATRLERRLVRHSCMGNSRKASRWS